MSFAEAAAVPLAAMTAYQMLKAANFKAGDKVFINAGAGGVGHYAIQIAKALKAGLIVATSSAPKHALLKSLGADEVIDYKTQKYTELYKDRRFDIGLDNAQESLKLISIVKKGGSVISVTEGFTSSTFTDAGLPTPNAIIGSILWALCTSIRWSAWSSGVSFKGLFLRANSVDLETLTKMIENGEIKSEISENIFNGIESSPAAMAKLESGRTTGKIVVNLVA